MVNKFCLHNVSSHDVPKLMTWRKFFDRGKTSKRVNRSLLSHKRKLNIVLIKMELTLRTWKLYFWIKYLCKNKNSYRNIIPIWPNMVKIFKKFMLAFWKWYWLLLFRSLHFVFDFWKNEGSKNESIPKNH